MAEPRLPTLITPDPESGFARGKARKDFGRDVAALVATPRRAAASRYQTGAATNGRWLAGGA